MPKVELVYDPGCPNVEAARAQLLNAIRGASHRCDPNAVSREHASHYKDVPAKLKNASGSLAKSKTLGEARAAYEKLSMPMGMWGSMSKPKSIDVLYCSMSKASWVQKHANVRNPHRGAKMLECAELVGGESYENPKR